MIARVHGVATAAGCQLVAACDLAVAVEEATFATPGVRIGLFCTTPMIPLVRAIPAKAAMEMLLTGRPISADRAFELGLVNRVVPIANLDSAIQELTDAIVASSARVITLGKRAFYDLLSLPEPEAYSRRRGDDRQCQGARRSGRDGSVLAKTPPGMVGASILMCACRGCDRFSASVQEKR